MAGEQGSSSRMSLETIDGVEEIQEEVVELDRDRWVDS